MEKIKGTELIKTHNVKNTPFVIIEETENKQFFGSIALYRITNYYQTKEECEKELTTITWDRISQVMMILIELKEQTLFKKNKKEP